MLCVCPSLQLHSLCHAHISLSLCIRSTWSSGARPYLYTISFHSLCDGTSACSFWLVRSSAGVPLPAWVWAYFTLTVSVPCLALYRASSKTLGFPLEWWCGAYTCGEPPWRAWPGIRELHAHLSGDSRPNHFQKGLVWFCLVLPKYVLYPHSTEKATIPQSMHGEVLDSIIYHL